MKRTVILLFLFILLILTFQVKEVSSENEFQTIPDEAIRLRILANSDSEEDQQIKYLVRDNVNEYINQLVEHIETIDEGRIAINQSVPEIEKIVSETLAAAGVIETFAVSYQSNITFPTKIYDNFIYPAGEYEAVLITIGEGKGSNWWCVLFPPLCFLDFSNGSTIDSSEGELSLVEDRDDKEDENNDEVEVEFFLFNWFGWT